jgi:hypothetical protein
MPKARVATPFTPEAQLKRKIRRHFTSLGFVRGPEGTLDLPGSSKRLVRNLHSEQQPARQNFQDKNVYEEMPVGPMMDSETGNKKRYASKR